MINANNLNVDVPVILGSTVTSGGALCLNSLTRAQVIILSRYLYTGSNSLTCKDFKMF